MLVMTAVMLVVRQAWCRLVVVGALFLLPWGWALAQVPVIEAVQMPAWVERGDARIPVAPGMQIQPLDRIVTGERARIQMRLPEGSTIKLGAQANFRVDAYETRSEAQGVLLRAVVNVALGAFRFTTAKVEQVKSRREVDIRFRTATAGIRGTDVWGESGSEREVVCLIEGRVEVNRAGAPAVTLQDPMSFYVAPYDRPALPVAPVSEAQLRQWAADTDIQAGAGVAAEGGVWRLVAAQLPDAGARALQQTLRRAGYPAELGPAVAAGVPVLIAGFASEEDARAIASRIASVAGVNATVTR